MYVAGCSGNYRFKNRLYLDLTVNSKMNVLYDFFQIDQAVVSACYKTTGSIRKLSFCHTLVALCVERNNEPGSKITYYSR